MISSHWEETKRIAEYAKDSLVSPKYKADLTITCWDAAYLIMQRSGAITNTERLRLMADSKDGSLTVLGNPRYQISSLPQFLSLPAGKVLAFVKPLFPGQPNRVSHVAITLGRGDIIGSNNSCVGGSPAWSKTSLANITFDGTAAKIPNFGQTTDFTLFLLPYKPIAQASCVIM
jgi:hypothetical protein